MNERRLSELLLKRLSLIVSFLPTKLGVATQTHLTESDFVVTKSRWWLADLPTLATVKDA